MSYRAAVLTEIITLIDSVSASDMVNCSFIPDVFQHTQKSLIFCQAAKSLENKCPASSKHIKKISRNLKSLEPKNCTIEENLPEINLNNFLASLRELTRTHLRKANNLV
ncbi:hypothetical protein XENTR_v10008204 [Xenopus tropicalis]|nr:hypothetical protein XENTR_v10008204 [Xenopus tropicalis]